MLPPDAVAALVDRHKQAQSLIAERTSVHVVRVWDDLGSWDRQDVGRFIESTAPHLNAAKKAAVTLAVGFYAQILQTRAPAIPLGAIPVEYRAETAFTALWHGLSEGRPFDEALTAGRSIAEAQVERYVASSARRTGDHVAQATRRHVGWRRVTSGKACPFCVRASGQTYKTSETADFGHDRCGCTAVPVDL